MKYGHSSLRSSRGFTILELMVATSVFAVILVVLTAGVISFTNSYYRGVNQTKTQTVARTIINDIAQSIQFGRQINFSGGDTGLQYICADNTLYSYKLNQEVVSNPQGPDQDHHGLTRTTAQGECADGSQASLDHGAELVGQNMRLSVLSITGDEATNSIFTIHVRVVYGDDEALTQITDPATEACKSGSGSQFCATSDLSTTVQSRFADPNL